MRNVAGGMGPHHSQGHGRPGAHLLRLRGRWEERKGWRMGGLGGGRVRWWGEREREAAAWTNRQLLAAIPPRRKPASRLSPQRDREQGWVVWGLSPEEAGGTVALSSCLTVVSLEGSQAVGRAGGEMRARVPGSQRAPRAWPRIQMAVAEEGPGHVESMPGGSALVSVLGRSEECNVLEKQSPNSTLCSLLGPQTPSKT